MRQLFLKIALLALLPALLIACGAPPVQPATVTPAAPVPAAPAAPKPLVPTVQPIGAIELTVDTRDATVKPAAITPNADAAVSFPTAGRVTEVIDVGSDRYIMARFPVTANQNFNNLTLVAYNKSGNAASSAFKAFQSFGGAPTSANVYSIRPAHGVDASAVVNVNKADLQVLTSAEAASVTAAARAGGTPIIAGTEYALEYGYVARFCAANCATATPTWTRAIGSGQTAQVTVALRVPQTGDPGAGYRFSMTFIVSNDTTTQYSQSLEEIAASTVAGIAQANAAITGATSVRVLCNSSYGSGNKAFILGARTAGDGATPLAQYGAQFYRNATAASFSVIPNVQGSFAPGVAPLYTALNGATLSFGGGSSANGGNAAVGSNGSFDFNPKAGSTAADTMNFTVSDDQGCASAPQTAPVTLSGPVIWFVNSGFAGTPDGRKTNPFTTLVAASSASSAGQAIFVYQGSYGALTLKANQTLIGQLDGLAVLGNAVVPVGTGGSTTIEAAAGTIPVLSAASGNTLTLTNGTTTVRGVKLGGSSAGVALSGTGFGTLNISNAEIASSGTAIDLSTGALSATFRSVSSSGGANGIKLNALTGAGLTVTGTGITAGSGGTITGTTGSAVLGTNVSAVNLQLMTIQNITAAVSSGVDLTNATSIGNFIVKSTSFQNITGSGFAIRAVLAGSGGGTVDFSNNTVGNSVANVGGISVSACGSTSACTAGTVVQGKVTSNQLLYPTSSTRIGIDIDIAGQGKMILQASNNTVQNYGLIGLRLGAREGNANLQATVSANTISTPTVTVNTFDGLNVIAGSGTSFTANTLCLNATGNTITVPANAFGIFGAYLEQRAAIGGTQSTFALQGIAPSPNTTLAQIESFVKTNNASLNAGAGLSFDSPTPRAINQTCDIVSF